MSLCGREACFQLPPGLLDSTHGPQQAEIPAEKEEGGGGGGKGGGDEEVGEEVMRGRWGIDRRLIGG